MKLHNPFTESTLEQLPSPASDPALALARAAHIVLEIAHHPQITPKVSPWLINIVRALKKQRLRAALSWGRGTSGSRAATAAGHAPSGRRAHLDLVPETADPAREA